MKYNVLKLVGPGLLLILLFQNCSKVAVDDIDSKVSASNGPDVVIPTDTVVPEELMKSCDAAKAAGRTSILKTEVIFDNKGQACEWQKNGNLTTLDGKVRARSEKYEAFTIPDGATVCDIQMEHKAVSNFLYDDNIIITLNDYVLTSTTTFSQHFTNTKGFYKYDWSRLVDKPAQFDKSDSTPDKQYCAGKAEGLSSCLFPQTETVGQIDLQLGERVIQNILAITTPHKLKLGVITTGDNDNGSDCQHTPIQLSVDIEYYR